MFHDKDMGCFFSDKCSCKKFEAKKYIIDTEDAEIDDEPQKGCGKILNKEMPRVSLLCGEKQDGELFLCPSCSRNHSLTEDREVQPNSWKRCSSKDKEPEVSQRVERTSSGSDFDLSEKIVFMTDYAKKKGFLLDTNIPVKDVKTFIKKLKPLVNKYVKYTVDKMAMWDEIYKLLGEKWR